MVPKLTAPTIYNTGGGIVSFEVGKRGKFLHRGNPDGVILSHPMS